MLAGWLLASSEGLRLWGLSKYTLRLRVLVYLSMPFLSFNFCLLVFCLWLLEFLSFCICLFVSLSQTRCNRQSHPAFKVQEVYHRLVTLAETYLTASLWMSSCARLPRSRLVMKERSWAYKNIFSQLAVLKWCFLATTLKRCHCTLSVVNSY